MYCSVRQVSRSKSFQKYVTELFEQIVRDRGSTVVMITHNPEIARMANRVVKLRNGVISSIRVNLHPAMATELVW